MGIKEKNGVFEETLKYFKGDSLAADVWMNKYALKTDSGYLESNPDEMHKRISKEFARIESKYKNPLSEQEIYELLKDFKYIIPAGSPMSGIGNNEQIVSLSNCFVIGNTTQSDSYGGILKIDEEQVQLMKRRGGVGTDLSHIRPNGTPVKNSALTSTGIVPFMERYSNTTKEVAQGGRRGALMLSLSVKHIDIESFMDSKLEQGKITGANISVKITDEFMYCVKNNKPFLQTYPIDLNLKLEDIDPNYEMGKVYNGSQKGTYYRVADAKLIWNKIILNAWKSAEPGVLFWDKIINESVPDCYSEDGFKTTSTNPCLVGDTMVAVADGRGDVSIKQLADEGNDVPVYCFDDNNNIVIRTMRNPRVTGYGENIYKITLDSGDVIRCTGNHKFLNTDGIYVRADNMKIGESLNITTRSKTSIISSDDKSKKYWALFSNNKKFFEHRMIASHYNNRIIESGYVVHHKDRNESNNNPDNLEIMKTSEHNKLHGEDMKGELNPMFGIINDEKRFAEYSKNMSEVVSGEGNGRFLSNITNDMIIENLCKYCISQKQPLSKNDIVKVLNGLGISSLTKFRQKELGSYTELSKKICEMVGMVILFDGYDTRLRKRAYQALDNGYEVNIENNKVLVKKNCENCGEEFWAEYSQREISFCSSKCSIIKYNKSDLHKKQVSESNKSKFEEVDNKRKQVYTKLKFDLGRKPSKKEWIEECVNNNISVDFRSEYSTYKTFEDFESEALMFNHRVISIELDGVENVYNGTVDEYHNFFVGGFDDESNKLYINNLNCGEIPLCPYDSCRLLSLNLYSYVKNPFTKNAEFDFDLFKSHVKIAQKLMDDLIDLEIEKIDKILEKINSDPEPYNIKRTETELWENIRDKTILGRRTGLGVTAEGDMLAAMGLTYGSDESIIFSTKIHQLHALSAYESSVDMAIDRGKFPIYNVKQEEKSGFIQRIKENDIDLYNRMIKHGRRNISLLTIAPNGSVSICTQTTSGIEPVFQISYKRRRKINPNDPKTVVAFIDSEGQEWVEYNVLHHKFITWLEVNGYNIDNVINEYSDEQLNDLIKLSPYYKSTSNDIDWVQKVKLQSSIQKWVDHSISVTVNIPKETSQEIVSEIYNTAWESGCKGMTIYRDGSRDGVLVTKNDNKKVGFQENNAPKRPKKLEANVLRFQNGKEKWVAVIGLLDGRPYEIFTGRSEAFLIPQNIEKGWVVRVKEDESKKARYDFIFNDIDGYNVTIEGLSRIFNKEYWNYAKLISGILRHGMPLPSVINLISNLTFDNDTITTWKNGVIRAIKKFIKDDTQIKGELCPNCGAETLVFIDGCKSCSSCGWSKCG